MAAILAHNSGRNASGTVPDKYLPDVELDEQGGHALPCLAVVLAYAVHRLRHILQHQVQKHLPSQPTVSALSSNLLSFSARPEGPSFSTCQHLA